ncbi:hypothetical protein BDV59DRAFT_166524 [Aspergillus ambiguus]|uniref:FAD-binding oxidoreductase n=1 Tax=Aspergillus ambiguus TaxID=176160 RepID=UPI003CCCC272
MPVVAVLTRLISTLFAIHPLLTRSIALENIQNLPASLLDCLDTTGSSVFYPSSPGYDALRRTQNADYSPRPAAIVQPTSSKEVAAILRCVSAEEGRVKLSPKGGGHSYAAYGFSGQVVIDSGKMKDITFNDARREVTVQFGQTLGPLATAMGRKGYALPHGTCPGVGVAGHSLGGGYGYTSRKWGWLLDHIVAMEFVDVHGNIKHLSSNATGTDAELWWGLRGAGANNFGVVTSFTYAMELAPAATVNFNLPFAAKSDCSQALLSLQDLGGPLADQHNGLPIEWGADLVFTGRVPGEGSSCYILGQYLGTEAEYSAVHDRLLEDLQRRGVKPLANGTRSREFKDWTEALTDIMGSLNEPSVPLSYYAKSLLDDGAPRYTVHDADSIMDAVQAARTNGAKSRVAFNVEGPRSRTNQKPPMGDTSFVHRDSLFIVQIYSSYGHATVRTEVVSKLDNAMKTVRAGNPRSNWHAYQNYVDPYLEDFGQAYYGPNLERLKSLKSLADPNAIFDYPQSLNHA